MTAELPGLTVTVAPPPGVLPPPLRTDIAGFLGATRRGPLGVPVRVEGWTGYRDMFGDLDPGSVTSYAVHGYFDNGGQLAWVTRVGGAGTRAHARWSVSGLTGFRPVTAYRVTAASPGGWANGGQVTIWYRSASLASGPEVDVRVAIPGEPVEVFTGIPAASVPERLQSSLLIRLVPEPVPAPAAAPAPAPAEPAAAAPGPAAPAAAPAPVVPARRSKVTDLILSGGSDAAPRLEDYQAAVQALADQPEVAIVAAPDLGGHLADGADRQAVVTALLATAASQLDRLVLIDVPTDAVGNTPTAGDALAWAASMLPSDPVQQRAGAVYYPGLLVPDPLGGLAAPLRAVPPSGHVAGVISRLDRERGAYYTPANAILDGAVDLDPALTAPEQVAVFGAGLNLLRCSPGRGLQVWGGRTLDPGHLYVAHRRLLHRLVRAVHRVADPLVFDLNGPQLRLSLVRAVTSVLLAAFRAGALAGARPQEGFQVVCDSSNNPPGSDPGQVVCDVAVAPAVPMEFIYLRLLADPQGGLEVIEA